MDTEQQFLQFADLRPDALLLVSGGGTILAANRGVERRLGLAPADLRGRPLGDFVEGPADALAGHLRACARSRELVLGSLTVKRPDDPPLACRSEGAVFRPRAEGVEAVVLLCLAPKEAATSRFVALTQQIDGLSAEIVRRKRVEEELRGHREQLRVTLGSIGDAVLVTDADARVTFLNPVAEGLTGWAQAEAAGRPFAEVFPIVNEQTRRPAEDPVGRVFREGVVIGLANHTILIARDGTERPIEDSAAPIRPPGGAIAGVVLVFRDVTEKRRAEAERHRLEEGLRRRNEQLAEADRRKDDFLALLGHELRNPLAPIRNAVTLLSMRPGDQAVVAQARAMIDRQATQMTRLVDELLDASRIARGKVQLRRERLDLAALVRAVADDHRAEVEASGLTLAVEVPGAPLFVHGDGARLAQVVGNLLHNASKFTDPGGRVTVRLAAEGGQADLRVEDTGVGIAPEALPKLFEVFSQVDATLARSKGGLGLGLSVVKGLVELHGGRVRAASDGPGLGAAFTAWVPLDHGPEPSPVAPVPATPLPAGRRKVLIVEDGRDAAESLRLLLALQGFEVVVAHSGPEGVEVARRFLPEAVVCDLGLPGMSGYEVARALRADPATASATLICASGYGQEEDRRQAREAGFDEALVKPVGPEVLLRLLARPRD